MTKKIISISVCAVFMLALFVTSDVSWGGGVFSPVSASENTITVENGNDSGEGSLRQAVLDINDGGTIAFSKDLTLIEIDSEIEIIKNISIIGNVDEDYKPVLTIKGSNSRILRTVFDASLQIENLILTGGKQTSSTTTPINQRDGGAIYALGNLVVNNCDFIDNKVTNGSSLGGAIYLDNASGTPGTFNLTITDSRFENNSAGLQGGAVCFYNRISFGTGTVNIYNSHFKNNETTSSSGFGGAVYISLSRGHIAGIYNSVFEANTAGSGGGAAIHLASNTRLFIANSTVFNNISNGTGGGAIRSSTDNAHISAVHNTIVKNTGVGICYNGAPHQNFESLSSFSGLYNNIIIGNGDGTRLDQTNLNSGVKGHNIIQYIETINDEPLQEITVNGSYDVFGVELNELALNEDNCLIPLNTSDDQKKFISGTFALTSIAPSIIGPDWENTYKTIDQTGKPRPVVGNVTFGSIQTDLPTPVRITTAVADDTESAPDNSLRKAVEEASAWDTIEIDADLTLTLAGEILIDKPLSIVGLGSGDKVRSSVIDANEKGRIFNFRGADTDISSGIEDDSLLRMPLQLYNLTLQNGKVENGNGGGVYSAKGLVWIDSCEFLRNTVTGDGTVGTTDKDGVVGTPEGTGLGGAVYVSSGTENGAVAAMRSRFIENSAQLCGGIYATSFHKIQGSTSPATNQRTYLVIESSFFALNVSNSTDTWSGAASMGLGRGVTQMTINSTYYANDGPAAVGCGMSGGAGTNARVATYLHNTFVGNRGRAVQNSSNQGQPSVFNSIIVGNAANLGMIINGVDDDRVQMGTSQYVNGKGNVIVQTQNVVTDDPSPGEVNTIEDVFGTLDHEQIMKDGYITPLADGPANALGAWSLFDRWSHSTPEYTHNLHAVITCDQIGQVRPAVGFVTVGAIQVDYQYSPKDIEATVETPLDLARAIMKTMPGDTLKISNSGGMLQTTSEIFINKPLKLVGVGLTPNEPFVIESTGAENSRRIFSIAGVSSDVVSFDNIRFTGAATNSNPGGGAIVANGHQVIGHVPMQLLFTNCVFDNNTTNNNGGAIFFQSAFAKFVNCHFEDNSTTESGGAVYYTTNTANTIRHIMNNTSGMDAINCSFVGNSSESTSANSGGSAIYTVNTALNVVNSTFYGNMNADNANNTGVIRGGNSNSTHINLYHCTVIKNNISETSRGNPSYTIYQQHATPMVRLYNSIVAGNGDESLIQQLSQNGSKLPENRLNIGNSIVQEDSTTPAYSSIFNSKKNIDGVDVELMNGRYVGVKEEASFCMNQPALDGTETGAPFDLVELLKVDQTGFPRGETVTLGAVELLNNRTIFYSETDKEELHVLPAGGEREIRVAKLIHNTTGEQQSYYVIVALHLPEGELAGLTVSSEEVTLADGDYENVSVILNADSIPIGSYIETYLWSADFSDNAQPLNKVVKLPAQSK